MRVGVGFDLHRTGADRPLRLGGVERLADATPVTVADGAVLDLDDFNESIDSISGAGVVGLGTAQLVVGLADGSGTFHGIISGAGDLLKEGRT